MTADEKKELAMNESLAHTDHNLTFASEHLRTALHFASPVEAMIILPLLEQIVKADNVVTQLLAARNILPTECANKTR